MAALTVLLGGCGQHPPGPDKTMVHRTDPKEQFNHIVDRFKRCYQNLHIVLPARSGDSFGRRLNVDVVVQDIAHQVTGCDGDVEPCTAQMIVRTRTDYSLYDMNTDAQTGQNEPDSAEDNRATAAGGALQDAESAAPVPERQRTVLERSASQLLNDRQQQQVHTVDFIFASGRWNLTSNDLDPSIKRAVQFALRSQ